MGILLQVVKPGTTREVTKKRKFITFQKTPLPSILRVFRFKVTAFGPEAISRRSPFTLQLFNT